MTQAALPPAPPEPLRAERSRAELLRAPFLLGGAGALALGALNLRDPHASGSWGFCPFLLITGEPCPACGGLRAMNDLTRGDVAAALSSNAAAVTFVAVMGVAWIVWVARRARGQDVPWIRLSRPWFIAVTAAMLVFAILRWTPWGHGLQP
ncbi:DUF2752 domain-containing protein [Aeromicrobium sp.]|uniref:DUF2752 domain-containing protein n=1 Tax=Aeromicrobium sp. TaxID=1871063 RepID=UPI0025C62033|nr:DUF2752 domain-containing protein [Aeromicrobium sp.]MCK5890635.1 DUF2752 domain-containing protein [Aeromicrobium sp.]